MTGQVGAINLERLDALIELLITYWGYGSNKSFFGEIKVHDSKINELEKVFTFEL